MPEYTIRILRDPDDAHYHTSIHGDDFIVTGVGCTRIASILEAAISLEDFFEWEGGDMLPDEEKD